MTAASRLLQLVFFVLPLAGMSSLNAGEAPETCLFTDTGLPAPLWICSAEYDGFYLSAVGSKSHMPSVSLQNRLAGRDAMEGVAQKINDTAKSVMDRLTSRPVSWSQPPYASVLAQLADTEGIVVIAKTSSTRHKLYVLAGMSAEHAEVAVRTAMDKILQANAAQLSSDDMKQLNEKIQALQWLSQRDDFLR